MSDTLRLRSRSCARRWTPMAGSYRGWSPIGRGEPPTEAAHLPVPLSTANVALFFQRRRLLIIFHLSAFLDLLHDHGLCASVVGS